MIDKNNLKRIRGVLSAKQGAEIPKFTPGGPLIPSYNHNDADFGVFVSKTGSTKNPMTWESYHKMKNAAPGATMDQLVNYWSGQEPLPNGVPLADVLSGKWTPSNVTTEVKGGTTTNPDAAVEKAAEIATKTEAATTDAAAAAEAQAVTGSTTGSTTGDGAATAAATSVNGSPAGSAGLNIVDPLKNTGGLLSEEDVKAAKKLKTMQNVASVGNAVFQQVGSAVAANQQATDSNLTKGADALYDGAAGAVENMGPVGKIVGTAMKNAKVAGDIIQSLGGGTDQQTTMDKIMDSAFFSWNIGMLNGFAGKNADSFGLDQDTLASVGSSYGGTASDLQSAANKAGKKYGLFSSKKRKQANAEIAEAKAKQNLMADISGDATDDRLLVQSMGQQKGLANSIMFDGGYSQKYTYAAKQGGILEWEPTLEWEPQVVLNWELPVFKNGGSVDIVEELEWIPEFKDGGKTEEIDIPEIEETTQKNLIPEGALHKNKHHMEHAEGLTKKGIPVIDEDGEQQAEIEHSEIIFTLEVTKKLEEYYEIFYSDNSTNKEKEQAAVDAGKLLVFQILENTEDRAGLIESCKKGGTITLKTTTDDLIEEVLEWMPTVVIVEEKEPEEKPKKKEEKSDKELMKEAIKEVLIELLTK